MADRKAVTIYIEPEQHRAIKIKATQEGKTITEVFKELVEIYLNK